MVYIYNQTNLPHVLYLFGHDQIIPSEGGAMFDLQGDWAGTIRGTNNADVFVEMKQTDNNVSGTARLNDKVFGTYLYHFDGKVQGADFLIEMKPEAKGKTSTGAIYVYNRPVTFEVPVMDLGFVTVRGIIKGETISGKWTSTIGTGGTFEISKIVLHKKGQLVNRLFVMMQISSDDPGLEDVLQEIKRASKSCGIDCIRADEVEHSGKLTDLILDYIDKSMYLVCDITRERPNVYYELGYVHGRKKEVILIAREGTTVHFNIKDYNIIFYPNLTILEERIIKRINAIKEK